MEILLKKYESKWEKCENFDNYVVRNADRPNNEMNLRR